MSETQQSFFESGVGGISWQYLEKSNEAILLGIEVDELLKNRKIDTSIIKIIDYQYKFREHNYLTIQIDNDRDIKLNLENLKRTGKYVNFELLEDRFDSNLKNILPDEEASRVNEINIKNKHPKQSSTNFT